MFDFKKKFRINDFGNWKSLVKASIFNFRLNLSWRECCRDELTTLHSVYRVSVCTWRMDDRASHKVHWEIITRSMGWKWFPFYTLRFIGFQRGLPYLANNCAWHFLKEMSVSMSVCSYTLLLTLLCHTTTMQDWSQGLRMVGAHVCNLQYYVDRVC